MKKKGIILGAVVIALVAFVGVAVKNKPVQEETIGGYKNGPRVNVVNVEKQDIETKVSSSGKLEAVDTQTLYIDTNNKVITLHKEIGDIVKKGELIITLDKEVQLEAQNQKAALEKQLAAVKQELENLQGAGSEGQILSAQSTIANLQDTKKQTENAISKTEDQIATLERNIKDAEDELEVNKELFEEGLVAQKDIDVLQNKLDDLKLQMTQAQDTIALSKSSLSTIDLQIKSAQYNLDVLQKKVVDKSVQEQIAAKQTTIKQLENQLFTSKNNLNKASTEVKAPMDGVITYLPSKEGMSLMPGSELVEIIDPSKLKVDCNVSTYYAPDLKVGLDAIVKYTGSKTVEVPCKVSRVSPVATSQTTANGESIALPIEVEVSQPGDIIRPGFDVDVKIITEARNGVCVVPILAIEEDEDISYVYVVGEDGTLEKREVVQGISNGLNIEVSGVEEGELVVSSIEDYVKDGLKVSYEKIGDEQ